MMPVHEPGKDDIHGIVNDELDRLTQKGLIVGNSRDHWRDYLVAREQLKRKNIAYRPGDKLFDAPDLDHTATQDELLENVQRTAMFIILSSREQSVIEGSEMNTVRTLARRYVTRMTSTMSILQRLAAEHILEIGMAGERLELWSGGPPSPL